MTFFSVITATFNNEKTLKDTVESVNVQNFKDFEHVVIDGGSTDETLKILKRDSQGFKMISEKDAGLYEALNKAISVCSGDVLVFLHADDFFPTTQVLEKVHKAFKSEEVDAVYGDLQYTSADGRKVIRNWRSGKQGRFNLGWMPPHTALFVRRTTFEKHGAFRLDMGSAADFEWMLRTIHVNRIKLAYIPEVLVKMRVGGVSNSGISARKEGLVFDLKAWEVNGFGKNYLAVILKKIRKLPQYIVS